MADKKETPAPKFYLDSTVLIDLIQGTRPIVNEIINKAKAKKWKYSVSAFTIMEALDIEQENMCFLIYGTGQ